ncbi:MAG: RtcB family protein [Bacillota bacterium]
MRTIHEGKLPIKLWAAEIEAEALQQAINLANLPFAYMHIAIMPDVHKGFGMPIGGVFAAEEALVPNAVGVDIGCGVVALQTDSREITAGQIKSVLQAAGEAIPVGFKHNSKPQPWDGFSGAPDIAIIRQELNSARKQISSLGSGNHFASIEQGDDGRVWLMVHSGSRNLGLKVASYYNSLARQLNHSLKIVPPEYDLAALPLELPPGREYWAAMNFCLEFARENRRLIIEKLYHLFCKVTGSKNRGCLIDIHHNYAALEEHFGKKVYVHRKGATRAEAKQQGIIPGSMGTNSYITEGLGNPASFRSCSHGAGRIMSRTAANKLIDPEAANRSMQGIVFNGFKGDLSEAPPAYKNIEQVMEHQKDLVSPAVKLKPLGVLKG